jgi:hypothetical protein
VDRGGRLHTRARPRPQGRQLSTEATSTLQELTRRRWKLHSISIHQQGQDNPRDEPFVPTDNSVSNSTGLIHGLPVALAAKSLYPLPPLPARSRSPIPSPRRRPISWLGEIPAALFMRQGQKREGLGRGRETPLTTLRTDPKVDSCWFVTSATPGGGSRWNNFSLDLTICSRGAKSGPTQYSGAKTRFRDI